MPGAEVFLFLTRLNETERYILTVTERGEIREEGKNQYQAGMVHLSWHLRLQVRNPDDTD